MRDLTITGVAGGAGVFGTITLEGTLSVVVALVTIAAMAPLAIQRWKKFLQGKDLEK